MFSSLNSEVKKALKAYNPSEEKDRKRDLVIGRRSDIFELPLQIRRDCMKYGSHRLKIKATLIFTLKSICNAVMYSLSVQHRYKLQKLIS